MVNVKATDGREEGDSSPSIRLFSSDLSAFLEISPDALVLVNQARIIVAVNPEAEALFGSSRAQLLDQPAEHLLPERFRDGYREDMTRYFSNPHTRPLGTGLSLFGLRRDGTEFPLDLSLKPLLLDERLVTLAAVRDMSAQRYLEEELTRRVGELERTYPATSQLAAIVESSNDAIIGKTLEGVITSWNSSAERLYGYAAYEVLGKPISLIIPPDRLEELPKILEGIKLGEATKRYETVRMRKDGTLIEVSVTVSPIRDVEGRIVGASTIAHDITEHKRMESELLARQRLETELTERRHAEGALRASRDELVALNAALEQANLVRSQFLATMSHELRTPLASIIGFSQMLLDDTDIANLNPQQQNDLERILKNSQHLLSLINDVLDLTKIDAGRMVVSYSQVDVRDLLNSAVEETQSLAIASHLVLRAEVQEGMDFLESNPLKLHQILLNLVSNALKFTERGGVMLSASRVLLSDDETEGIAFAVQDSGIGIPPELHERIFEAFYQTDMSYKRRVGGTGLGLAIVSQLTVLLGGTITVASVPGQGSTFTVTLPVKATHGFMK